MKTLTIFLLMTVLGSNVHAATKQELCSAINQLAGSIMTSRQNGVPMEKAMTAMNSVSTTDGKVQETINNMVMDAYQRPYYSSKELQQREVVEFQNRWYMQCLKSDIEK